MFPVIIIRFFRSRNAFGKYWSNFRELFIEHTRNSFRILYDVIYTSEHFRDIALIVLFSNYFLQHLSRSFQVIFKLS